ncbi:MAG: DNA circularization N-terminal domain-containing protein [Bacteroidota bacterium]
MPIELAGISLNRIYRLQTQESADFVAHRVPGLEGNLTQDMGRASVKIEVAGIFYGEEAETDMEALRDVYKAREPVDFLADIVGQAYFSRVILEGFEVDQQANEPGQFSYRLLLAEYVPPPVPATPGLEEVDAAILDEAQNFMDIADLPATLALPEFSDPTEPLSGILDGAEGTLSGLDGVSGSLLDLFGT